MSRGLGWLLLAAGGMGLALSTAAVAQDPADAGMRVWRTSGCGSCHGNFGEGGGGGEQPQGPNIRRTELDQAGLEDTIRCGRPGTEMPFFLKGAYTEIACFGLPVEPDPPKDVRASGRLSEEQVDNLVAYLMARVVGQSDDITKAECDRFFGRADHPTCEKYK